MKKSLVALAVLATTGAALAQSNVTLYGRIDTSIGSNKLNGVSTTQLFSGNLSSTRWGVRGSEDLGGGLKATFKLEQRIDEWATAGCACFGILESVAQQIRGFVEMTLKHNLIESMYMEGIVPPAHRIAHNQALVLDADALNLIPDHLRGLDRMEARAAVVVLVNADYGFVSGTVGEGLHVIRNPLDVVVSAWHSHRTTHSTDGWPV